MRIQRHLLISQYILYWQIFFFIFTSATPLTRYSIEQAASKDYPYIVGITRRVKNVFPERDLICTGAIFSRQHALTSEHCLRVHTLTGIQLVVESIDIITESRYYPAWWLTFDQWRDLKLIPNRFLQNDICIIRLTEDVPDEFPFANLSFMGIEELDNKNGAVIGWGERNSGSNTKTLQVIHLKLLSKKDCERTISRSDENVQQLDDNLFCTARDPLALLMQGDSGGPLLYNNSIVAINMGKCLLPQEVFNPDKVNLHTSILHYREFLTDVINNF